MKKLGIDDLDYRDLRFEATVRLFEREHAPHEVARILGVKDLAWLDYLFNKYRPS